MKLFKYGPEGREKCGVLIDSQLFSVARLFRDYDENFFTSDGLSRLEAAIKACDPRITPIRNPDKVRLGSPLGRPSKLVCIGLNYARHAQESGMAIPPEPVIFFKSTTAICGPNDQVIIPKNSVKTDWEVELAFVIGKRASYVSLENAMDHVAGYLLHNDISEREFQMERSGQWVKGKSCDTFAPLGPWFVTKEEISDPHNLHLWLDLNGQRMQDSNTSDMVYKIPFLVHYISQFMTLLPGDIISTGTPFGVGFGLNPQRYLVAGDVVELGVEGLGTQRQVTVACQL
jgi:2-keto-4-pentenoate hydratase/2-oxohepta-3-ene-1,7-dioic acid hydratase in catechol pathway